MKSSSHPSDDELNRLVALGITRHQVERGNDCLDPEVLASYADGGLPPDESAQTATHLATCPDCRSALALLIDSDPLLASRLAATTAALATDGTAAHEAGTDGAKSAGTAFAETAIEGAALDAAAIEVAAIAATAPVETATAKNATDGTAAHEAATAGAVSARTAIDGAAMDGASTAGAVADVGAADGAVATGRRSTVATAATEASIGSMQTAAPTAGADSTRSSVTTGNFGARSESRDGPSGQASVHRPTIVKLASTWLPLAAALVVATGLWLAFNGSRREASQIASAPAQLSARNDVDAAKQVAEERAARERAGTESAAKEVTPPSGEPAEPAADDAKAAQGEASQALSADQLRAANRRGEAAATSRTGVDVSQPQASVATRERDARHDGFAEAARPNTQADRRTGSAPLPPAVAAPAPPPPQPALAPSPAALADASPARPAGTAGREAQGTVAGQLGPAPRPAASPAAPPAPAPDQVAANQATQSNQTAQVQGYAVNQQQTGPMSNLNAAPPPAKADERRQADRAKNERVENEKSAGGPSGAKSDGALAKAAEEPKSLARAKTAPQGGTQEKAAAAQSIAKADQRGHADRAKGEGAEKERNAGGASGAKSSDGAIAKAGEEPKLLARAKTASPDAGQDKAAAASAPAKPDERKQADRAKGERAANEKGAGGPSGGKSSDGALAKAAEEPKSLARAKTAPQGAQDKAAPAPTAPPAAPSPTPAEVASAAGTGGGASATGGNARSGSAASPTFRAAADAPGAASGVVGGAAAGSDRNGDGRAAVDAVGARPADTSAGGINEAVTLTSAPPASLVLRSADGGRWWRIRAPSTIEGSSDRGATWTVEYSEPSARIVRGAAAAKGGCWMIGANGLVLRTRPSGGWERVTQPTTRALVTVTAIDHSNATVTDDQGRNWRTTDGGASWR